MRDVTFRHFRSSKRRFELVIWWLACGSILAFSGTYFVLWIWALITA